MQYVSYLLSSGRLLAVIAGTVLGGPYEALFEARFEQTRKVSAQAAPNPVDWDHVGTIDIDDLQVRNAENLLRIHGIRSGAIGSIAYWIVVPKEDVAAARSVLNADARERPYKYYRVDGFSGKLGLPEYSDWPFVSFHLTFEETRASHARYPDLGLRAASRTAILNVERDENIPRSKLRVTGAQVLKVLCWNRAGKLAKAYHAIVAVGSDELKFERHVRVTAWGDGSSGQAYGSW